MAVTYGFYNSSNGDRKYNALQFSRLFEGIIRDGVFSTVGGSLMVVAASNLTVNISSGRAWFNNTWTNNDALLPLTLDPAEAILNRYDAVVLEVAPDERENRFKIVKGTPATTPAKPTMIKTGGIYQYPLAYIYVGKGVESISQANISNAVGTAECPFITGALQQVTTNDIIAQWESEFNTWFDDLQAQLEGNVVTNLQNQINTKLTADGGDGKDVVVTFTEAVTEAHIASGEKLSVMFGKILKKFKSVVPISLGGTGATSAVNALKALGNGYGTCTTAASTAAKVGTLSGFSLVVGGVVGLKFTNANTHASPTLNVNGTGAKPIRYKGAAPLPNQIGAGMLALFQYDGTNWNLLNPYPTGNTVEVLTASGTWTVPEGVHKIDVLILSGGGGGSPGSSSRGSGGGGAGHGIYKKDLNVIPGEKIPIIIGSGGASASHGGYSRFADLYANGGKMGTAASTLSGGGGWIVAPIDAISRGVINSNNNLALTGSLSTDNSNIIQFITDINVSDPTVSESDYERSAQGGRGGESGSPNGQNGHDVSIPENFAGKALILSGGGGGAYTGGTRGTSSGGGNGGTAGNNGANATKVACGGGGGGRNSTSGGSGYRGEIIIRY